MSTHACLCGYEQGRAVSPEAIGWDCVCHPDCFKKPIPFQTNRQGGNQVKLEQCLMVECPLVVNKPEAAHRHFYYQNLIKYV